MSRALTVIWKYDFPESSLQLADDKSQSKQQFQCIFWKKNHTKTHTQFVMKCLIRQYQRNNNVASNNLKGAKQVPWPNCYGNWLRIGIMAKSFNLGFIFLNKLFYKIVINFSDPLLLLIYKPEYLLNDMVIKVRGCLGWDGTWSKVVGLIPSLPCQQFFNPGLPKKSTRLSKSG